MASCASSKPAVEAPGPWRTEVEPYLWLVGIKGDVESGAGSPEVSLDDPLALDGGGLLQVELKRGDWAIRAEGLYVDFEGTTRDLGAFSSRVGIEATILELSLRRRIEEWEFQNGIRKVRVDGVVGARYASTEISIETQGSGTIQDRAGWIDPLLGFQLEVSMPHELSLLLAADVGGFGLASDLVWSATLRADWRAAQNFRIFLGYSLLDFDFKEGPDSSTFRYDVRLGGPLVGFTIGF